MVIDMLISQETNQQSYFW